jgi:hypothetical protein
MEKVLGQEDYFKGYQDNIDELREKGDKFEFDKSCFEVFSASDEGKKLLDYFLEKVVMASVPAQVDGNYGNACMYFEGYREGFRQIIHGVKSYPERKKAEEKAKERSNK